MTYARRVDEMQANPDLPDDEIDIIHAFVEWEAGRDVPISDAEIELVRRRMATDIRYRSYAVDFRRINRWLEVNLDLIPDSKSLERLTKLVNDLFDAKHRQNKKDNTSGFNQ